jgi:2'-5' RNA ligase
MPFNKRINPGEGQFDGGEERHFSALWDTTLAQWRRNNVQVDPLLAAQAVDRRMGLTLIARPGKDFLERLGPRLHELSQRTGRQYVYPAQDLHVSLLSLVSGTEGFAPAAEALPGYLEALGKVFSESPPCDVAFRGFTASPEAIMIKVFSRNGGMNLLRDGLREALHASGLGGTLDKRYRKVADHMTVLRFLAFLPDVEPLIRFLDENQDQDFGAAHLDRIELVHNDWYMSAAKTRKIAEWKLTSSR